MPSAGTTSLYLISKDSRRPALPVEFANRSGENFRMAKRLADAVPSSFRRRPSTKVRVFSESSA